VRTVGMVGAVADNCVIYCWFTIYSSRRDEYGGLS
jgi:hypothetical protein